MTDEILKVMRICHFLTEHDSSAPNYRYLLTQPSHLPARLSDRYVQMNTGVKGQYAGRRPFGARAALDSGIYLNYNLKACGRKMSP